jgi:hypothetical protein
VGERGVSLPVPFDRRAGARDDVSRVEECICLGVGQVDACSRGDQVE